MNKALAILMSFFACSSAQASPIYEFTPSNIANIPAIIYSGKPINIVGIESRMQLSEVEKILNQEYKGSEISRSTTSFGGKFNGESVRIASFVSNITVIKRIERGYTEDLRVYFSSPATGQRVVSVTRSLVFDGEGNAPAFDAATASIIEKYGAQPNPDIVPGGRQVSYSNVTKNGKKIFCGNRGVDGCNYISVYQPELANQYISRRSIENGLMLAADLKRGTFSENKIGQMSIQMFDFDFAIQAAQADLGALQEAGAKRMVQPNITAVPKL